MKKDICSICGQYKKIRIPEIGIAFGFAGQNYIICVDCCKITVDEMFKIIALQCGYKYPLRYKNKDNWQDHKF